MGAPWSQPWAQALLAIDTALATAAQQLDDLADAFTDSTSAYVMDALLLTRCLPQGSASAFHGGIMEEILLRRRDGEQIAYLRGPRRAALEQLMRQHYLGCGGGSGYAVGVLDPDGRVVGGVLIGRTASQACDRSIAASSHEVRAIKRVWVADHVPVPESQVMRRAIQFVADLRQETILFVSYADPGRSTRASRPRVRCLGG